MAPVTDGPRLSLREVRAGYGPWARARPVLRATTWEAPPGRITALVGPNGVGKTTTLRLLLGLARPVAGRVTVGGLAPAEHRRRHGVGFLPEEGVRLPGWTVGALLAASRADPGEGPGPAASVLVPPGLLRRPVEALSRGQARAVLLARALDAGRGLLLLDEPWSGLDPAAREALARLLVARAAGGATVVLSSHEMLEVGRVADRAVALAPGGRATTVERRGGTAPAFAEAVRAAGP